MRIENGLGIHAVRCAVTVGSLLLAPVLLVAGDPLRRRLWRHTGEHGRGLVAKEEGWVSPVHFVVTNAVFRSLCGPSAYVLRRRRPG
ncbi:hypothetical protein SNE510_09090 [Streptomyces sp. NE5-10]|uniref:hypothetical protein n=1 Tax=Streptomyces sp. NE5-10 TaxID=2759674 RepID=UPI001906FB8D|nr:hypothetical protein [Streptomyces sp. NE5-10]GHJ91390.1 hypothetical protein SNE510_09090 [Streptomyces sp. NE5-10]